MQPLHDFYNRARIEIDIRFLSVVIRDMRLKSLNIDVVDGNFYARAVAAKRHACERRSLIQPPHDFQSSYKLTYTVTSW